ncbi:MAG: HD domain-containing protein [Candidatus Omnitrophica bacterium]|nr:HD domain-containing protein [Candidatus Omnitrophota bacterium]
MEQTFEKLSQHPSLRRLHEVITAPVSRPIWWVIPGDAPKTLNYSQACRTCRFVQKPANRRICQRQFLSALEEARKAKGPVQFVCPIERHAVCLPVMQQDQVRGYLAMCHSEQPVPSAELKLAGLTVATAAQEMERTQELKNLSDAIQPRCVALSTIHTIHRLISSTLNLKELLPRVARLCCQVLRAQSCAIWLVDRQKRLLIPRAVVELRKGKSWTLRPCRVGSGFPGQVASTCQARLSKRMMVVPLVEEDCVGVIMVRRYRPSQPFSTLDQEILTTLAEQAVVAIGNAQMYETQERVTWGTIKSLSEILNSMEPYSSGRSLGHRILAEAAVAIAQKMKLPLSAQRPLQYAALLHDAGRLGIPQEILRKPTKLEPAEFAKVKEHTIKGARLLQPFEILEPALPIILYHHERYDGTGYPKGLKKDAIPLGARILAVANAFEAMVCERPYRGAFSVTQAAHEIASHSGTQFDPAVVEAFLSLVQSGKLQELVDSAGSKEIR